MLRRNIDTKVGLVNGVIGTVVAISVTRITIKFDHATDPYDIERVKSAFIVNACMGYSYNNTATDKAALFIHCHKHCSNVASR